MAVGGIALLIAVAASQIAFEGNALEGAAANGGNQTTFTANDQEKLVERPIKNTKYLDFDKGGIPSQYATSPQKLYRHVSKCYARQSFEKFFKSNQADPDSIFNNREKQEKLTDIKRAYFESDLDLMNSAKAECAAWDSKVSGDLVGVQLYTAALNAALAGDDNATACLINSPWTLPKEDSYAFAALADSFKASVDALVQRGIENGNWKVVTASVRAYRERVGIGAMMPGNEAKAYYFARLGQIGSVNDELASSFGYDASNFAKLAPKTDVASAESAALHDYNSYFNNTQLSEEDITVRCGN